MKRKTYKILIIDSDAAINDEEYNRIINLVNNLSECSENDFFFAVESTPLSKYQHTLSITIIRYQIEEIEEIYKKLEQLFEKNCIKTEKVQTYLIWYEKKDSVYIEIRS